MSPPSLRGSLRANSVSHRGHEEIDRTQAQRSFQLHDQRIQPTQASRVPASQPQQIKERPSSAPACVEESGRPCDRESSLNLRGTAGARRKAEIERLLPVTQLATTWGEKTKKK